MGGSGDFAADVQEATPAPSTQAGPLAAPGGMGAGELLRAMHDDSSRGISVPKPFSEPILLLEQIHVAGTRASPGACAFVSSAT